MIPAVSAFDQWWDWNRDGHSSHGYEHPTRPDFDLLSMHILEDVHAMSIESALVAQRLAKNSEIRAFAKHAADVAKLHVLLLDDLQYRLAFNITLPEPRFQEDYQSPRRLELSDNEIQE